MLSNFWFSLRKGFNRAFIFKVVALCLCSFLSVSAFTESSYSFGYEKQNIVRCLPQVFWLLDSDVDVSKITYGSLIKLDGKKYNNHFNDDISLLKMVVAKKGDAVYINSKERTIFINGSFYGTLPSDKPPFHDGYYTLKDNEIWIAGTSDTTIDSRYFGPATLSQIEAHAYALL
jgi:hypothetical protein